MRQNPHVRICGGPGSATTLVYPTPKRDHRVPLSGRALAILHDARRRSDGTGLVFRSLRGKPLCNTTLSKLIKELGLADVPHGVRGRASVSWAAERTSTPREVVEAALAHTVQNPTEAAYARSDLFERRRAPDGRLGRVPQWGPRARSSMKPVTGCRLDVGVSRPGRTG